MRNTEYSRTLASVFVLGETRSRSSFCLVLKHTPGLKDVQRRGLELYSAYDDASEVIVVEIGMELGR